MRRETRMALGVVGLSALTTSYLLGHQAQDSGLALSATAANTIEQTPAQQTSEPAVTASETPTQTSAPEATNTAAPKATATQTPAPVATSTQEPAVVATGTTGTFASAAVRYKYGTIQLEISVADGALTGINMLQATTEGKGYDQAPPILVDAAIQAGGTNFGNLSGATFTTQAFKQALNDALAQAGM